jgi:hypothetical protein
MSRISNVNLPKDKLDQKSLIEQRLRDDFNKKESILPIIVAALVIFTLYEVIKNLTADTQIILDQQQILLDQEQKILQQKQKILQQKQIIEEQTAINNLLGDKKRLLIATKKRLLTATNKSLFNDTPNLEIKKIEGIKKTIN